MSGLHKLPRLYVSSPLGINERAGLSSDQAHYLKNVLRNTEGDYLRLFNGQDGEWLCRLERLQKKTGEAVCVEQLKAQPDRNRRIHLLFAPIKKARMDILIEKAVELGVTDLHPVLTEHCEVRKINAGRFSAQIIEAAEQCERLDIPNMHELASFPKKLDEWDSGTPLLAAIAREQADPLQKIILHFPKDFCNIAALVGPEGGFTVTESGQLKSYPFTQTVSLGPYVLRSETAALKILSCIPEKSL